MDDLPIGQITMGLFGGLALFLFGMELMADSLKAAAGTRLRQLLANLTSNRFLACVTGAFATAAVQSSSVTTVLTVGFVSAGLMSLEQSIGIILGANIGTTVTAQIIAFKVTHYALIPVAIGFAMKFLSPREAWRRYGTIVLGLGLLFFGMALMSDATRPLRDYQPFVRAMESMSDPVRAILAAAAFTALIQSSAATTGIVIVLASQGFITLEAGIALTLGANVGTCVTAGLAALGRPRAATQVATIHLLFNVVGVLIWLPFIEDLAAAVRSISPSHEGLGGSERLAAETARQIANAHTVFNVANAALFIGFTGPLAWLVRRVLPEKADLLEVSHPKYLDETCLQAPAFALDRIRLETLRMGRVVAQLVGDVRPALVGGSEDSLRNIVRREREVERLHEVIVEFSRRLSSQGLTKPETRRLSTITAMARNVQHVAETLGIYLVAVGRERLARGVQFSAVTLERFEPLGREVRMAFEEALSAFENDDVELARRVVARKAELRGMADGLIEHLGERLLADAPHRMILYRMESQAVELLLRMYYFAKKIGKEVIEQSAEREPTDSE